MHDRRPGTDPAGRTAAPAPERVDPCPTAPSMVELKYELMVRRGQAWGRSRKLQRA